VRGARRSSERRDAVRLWLRVLSCTNAIEGRLRSELRRKFDTTLPRFDVLAQLEHAEREGEGEGEGKPDEGLTMSELSRRLMVSNGNVTGLIERLDREGLVSRARAANDRRRQVVRLTSAGRRAFRTMLPEHSAWVMSMFSGLTAGERRRLYELVGKLKGSVMAGDGARGTIEEGARS
jgi:DNA-binding MarR family transcriptional regulator